MDKKKENMPSRRKFLKQIAAGTLGLAMADKILPSLKASPMFFPENKSKVILVRHEKVISPTGEVQQEFLHQMMTRGMAELSGKTKEAESWLAFFNPGERIGIKINTLGLNSITGTSYINHFKAVTSEITDGLTGSGIEEQGIVIWERSDEELINAAYRIQREPGKLRVMGTRVERRGSPEGFHPTAYPMGNSTTRVHSLITDECDGFINVPVLKTHGTAGITGSLKTHYGSIDNPREFHANNATHPGIPEINTIPVIRKKQKLIICDALLGVFDGGPRWNADKIWPYGALIFGTDPVAADRILLNILDEKRKQEGYPLAEDNAIHIALAGEMGLGNHRMEDIDLIEINLV